MKPPPYGVKAEEATVLPFSDDISTAQPNAATTARRSHDSAYTSGSDSSHNGKGRGESAETQVEGSVGAELQHDGKAKGGNQSKEGGTEKDKEDRADGQAVELDEGPYKGGNHVIVNKILMSYLQVRAGRHCCWLARRHSQLA